MNLADLAAFTMAVRSRSVFFSCYPARSQKKDGEEGSFGEAKLIHYGLVFGVQWEASRAVQKLRTPEAWEHAKITNLGNGHYVTRQRR